MVSLQPTDVLRKNELVRSLCDGIVSFVRVVRRNGHAVQDLYRSCWFGIVALIKCLPVYPRRDILWVVGGLPLQSPANKSVNKSVNVNGRARRSPA